MGEQAVVDTNVMLTANKKATTASPQCVDYCVARLSSLMRDNGKIILDDDWRVLGEYKHQLSPRGQPGVGDAFYRWVLTNYKNPARCELHPLTERPGNPDDFVEFPDAPALKEFDWSDRKFAALAVASGVSVWNAVDSDWWNFREALHAHGVMIEFLCPDQFAD